MCFCRNFLQNLSLKTDAGTVSNAAPDICIAYKLHLECGRLINLYDWLEVSPPRRDILDGIISVLNIKILSFFYGEEH